MLNVLLLSLILNFVLVICVKNVEVRFNNSILVTKDNHHAQPHTTFFKSVKQKLLEERSVLRAITPSDDSDFFEYSITKILPKAKKIPLRIHKTPIKSTPEPNLLFYQQFKLPSLSSESPYTPNSFKSPQKHSKGFKSPSSLERLKDSRSERSQNEIHISSNAHPNIYQRGVDRTQGLTSSKETVTQISMPLSSTSPNTNYMKIWLNEMYNYTPVNKRLLSLTVREMTPSYCTSTRSPTNHTTSTRRVRGRLRNRLLKTTKSSTAVPRQSISLSTTPAEVEDHVSITKEGRPVYKSYDQTSAASGDVVHEAITASPYKRYEDMMDDFKEGYMIVFLLELTRLVIEKEPEHVSDVIGHTDSIITELSRKAQLAWLGHPLMDVTMSIGRFLTEAETDAVRSYASMMHHLLRTRRSALAADLNSIIDYADLLYEHDEGYMLFDSLMEFHNYPIVSRTSREVCEDLIESFLRPFRRLHHSEHRQALLDSINNALETRFPGYMLTRAGKDISGEDVEDQSSLPTKNIVKKSSKHGQRGSRNKNLYTTKTIRVEYTNESVYRRHYTPVEVFPMTRSLKPITQLQRRFSIILPRFRGITQTEAQFLNVRTRPTTDYEAHTNAHTTQLFHEQQATLRADAAKKFERREQPQRHRSTAETDRKTVSVFLQMKRSLEESRKKAVSVRRKAELLRRIVESSSYSDEEEALKRNLLQALQRNSSGVEDTHADYTVDDSVKDIESKRLTWPNDESEMSLEEGGGDMQNEL